MSDKLTRSEILTVSHSAGSGFAGPTWRRIDCTFTAVAPVWGVLVEFGPRFLLEDLHPKLTAHPPAMFSSEMVAIEWLVDQINETPELVADLRAQLDKQKAVSAAAEEARLAAAREMLSRAEERGRSSEGT